MRDNHEAFRTYGLIIGAAVGLGFAFWRAKIATKQAVAAAARADAAIEQSRAANQQAHIAEQGHITERFSRAVEQLGHDRVAVRIGGLYALKRIAEDSVERDHLAVMDVLTNFIRQPPYATGQVTAARQNRKRRVAAEADQSDSLDQTASAAKPLPEPYLIDCPDIEAAIEIIQGRSEDQKAVEEKREYRLSLSRATLSYLRLPGVDLQNFDLAGANFTSTELTRTNLVEANLVGAKLLDANLVDANLLEADLSGADLSGAILNGAELTDAKLRFANLKNADLADAKLTGAKLMSANLTGSDLRDTDLSDTDFRGANLSDASLTEAELTRAKLAGANLSGADLKGADFKDTNLRGANLTGADFTRATNLTQQQLNSARCDPSAPPNLPTGMTPPETQLAPSAEDVHLPPPEAP